MATELIRRGLPAEYARRAAAELADHHRDLVEELQAAGWTEYHAQQEASRRLGERRALVKKTVGEYQSRYWCGRWPLITFFLGPIPALLLVWLATGLVLAGIGWVAGMFIDEPTTTAIETAGQYVVCYALKIWLVLASPALVVSAFCWLAARAAVGRAWAVLATGMISVSIAFAFCGFDFKTGPNSTGRFMIGYHPWFMPENFNSHLLNLFTRDMWQISQLIVPLIVGGFCMLYFRARLTSQALLTQVSGPNS
jgi:hypothetical protein